MTDAHGSATQRFATLEKRLAALHDLGVDTGGLRSQLAFARQHVAEGRRDESLLLCDEIESAARRLAESGRDSSRENGKDKSDNRVRSGRFTRDQLTEAVKEILASGVLARALANQEKGPDLRLELRLQGLEEKLTQHMGHEADALRIELQVQRQEIEQLRRQLAGQPTPAIREPAENSPLAMRDHHQTDAAVSAAQHEPVWAQALIANLQAITECLKSPAPIQSTEPTVWITQEQAARALAPVQDELHPTDVFHAAPTPPLVVADAADDLAANAAPENAPDKSVNPVTQSWATPLAQSLHGIVERLQNLPAQFAAHQPQAESEPAWTAPLVQSLQAVVERLQTPHHHDLAQETPPWVAGVVQNLQAVAERLQTPPAPPAPPVQIPSPLSSEEPVWVKSVVDSFAAMVERLQQMPAPTNSAPINSAEAAPEAADAPNKSVYDSDLASILSRVVEKGFAGLGALIRDSQSAAAQSSVAFKPMEETSMTLAPMTTPPMKTPGGLTVEPMHEDGTTKLFDQQVTRTDKMAVAMTPALSDSLRALVVSEIESRLGQVGYGSGASSAERNSSDSNRHTAAVSANAVSPDQVRALFAAEWERRSGGAIERNADSDLRANVVRILPSLLEDEQVRQQLFAVLALEAIEKPGILAEITGLRNFLKRELQHAAEELAGRLQTS
jgi:polyhydroxyalkanoate synthesis regulator phasin